MRTEQDAVSNYLKIKQKNFTIEHPGIVNRTQSNCVSTEHNRTQFMDWLRLRSGIEPNRTQAKILDNQTKSNI